MMTAGVRDYDLLLRVLLVSWMSSATVYSYEDLRSMPCRNQTTYSEVPADRASWLGSVTLTLECDPGYDLPLNSPHNSTFTCLPNGASWQPDYVPDCNDKIVPNSAQMTIYGHFSKATCDSLGALTVDKNTLAFASSHRLNLTQMCSRSQLHGCVVVRAFTSCENKAAQGLSSPHIFLQVNISLASSTSWATYRTESEGLALSVLRDLDHGAQSSQVNASIQPVCRPGTVGVLRAGSEVVCRGCSLGHYLDSKERTCLPCPPGYYGDQPLSTSCQQCPGLGTWVSDEVWRNINKVVPDRAHTVGGCPIIYKHMNGSVEVRVPTNVHIENKQVDKHDNNEKREDPKNGGGGGAYTDALIYLVVCCLVLAALLIL